jgi:hypothetical protein
MSNIDLTRIITAEEKAARQEAARRAARKSECRARIFAVVDQTAQMNLAAAAAAGALTEEQMTIYRSGLSWIHAMRAACAEETWPDLPPGVAALAARY